MSVVPQEMLVGAGGGAFAGYAIGRITKMAMNIMKWLAAFFVGIQVTLDQMGFITIHYGKVSTFMQNQFGGDGIQALVNSVTDIIFSWVPMAGGFGAGFYAGYKKMIV